MERQLFEHIYETIAKKETTYDGVYYTCVRTTRIFCRPSCRARTPYAKNVTFVTSAEDAVEAGYRPCKRCVPEAPGAQGPEERLAERVDVLIRQQLGQPVTLKSLADQLAVSPFHLQRLYTRVKGYSPAEQLKSERLAEAKRRLRKGDEAIAAIGAAVGFRSPSHFAAWLRRETGLTPTELQQLTAPEGGEEL
ncbi:AraC family transcriptional regulator [Paenibacillus swuensis]|uniref:AraC family transcriptional regulator n=1 Tax=Paenibacillus swuensis TaxID=1178515 RepID=A0A172THM0_9BACL|nr:Ada metal-binding domain-containing protein [Paenibacillus swuensis]ANE46510.1 AraC family transcriptional regulator [Paenibacillus swuensis]